MKYIKYLIAVLLLGATLASCAPNEGTVGQTTVQFKSAKVVEGFGAGTVYVPISIFGANLDAMNTAPVNVKVKLDPTYTGSEEGVALATEDLTGKPDETTGKMGDIRITSCDMVFSGNYKVEEGDEKKPVTKDIAVEIMIINTEPEIMEFKLLLETDDATVGPTNACVVRLEKGPADRLCGDWWVDFSGTIDLLESTPDFTGPFQTTMYYDSKSNALMFYEPVVDLPFIFFFDSNSEKVTYPTFEVIGQYDEGMYICQWVFKIEGDMFVYAKDKTFACEYDNVNYTYLKIPKMAEEGWSTLPVVLNLDENYNILSIAGFFHNESLIGMNLVRTKPVGKAPAMAPSADYAVSESEVTTFVEVTKEQSDAMVKAYYEQFGTLKVNVR